MTKKKNGKKKAKKRIGGRRKLIPEVDPSLLASYYDDPIAMLQDEDYPALYAWELARDGLQEPPAGGSEDDNPDDIPF